MLLELVIGGVVLLAYFIWQHFNKKNQYWKERGVEQIKVPYGTLSGLYYVLARKKNILDFDTDAYVALGNARFGGTVDFGKPSLLIKDPELIRDVLVKDFDHFVDRRKMKLESEPIFQYMLTMLEGQEWKNVRSVVSPTFTTGKIRRMFENFNRCGADLIEFIKSKPVGSPGTRDVVMKEFVSRYLVDVIGATAFGMDTSSLKDPNSIFYKMAKQQSEFSMMKMAKIIMLMAMPFLGKLGIRFSDAGPMDFFENILRTALKNRQESNEKREDFLQLMIEARKGELKTDDSELDAFEKDAQLTKAGEKSKVNLSDEIIVAQSLLFFLAGLDTTGAVLCFAYYVLALNQDIQEKLYEEVGGAMKNGNVDYEATTKMEYMDKFISELLRMYPPGTRLERRCTREWQIPGTKHVVEKDVLVYMPVISMHRDPNLYPNPDNFDPERFTPEAKAARNPYTYMPFGQGPRNCIGMRFALMEAKVALAYVVYNFIIEPSAKTPVPLKLDPNLGARPEPTVELRFKERTHN